MLKFCYGQRGAISVFLMLILLPVLLLGGLTTDAARIYGAKVMISDAGEMAMNAGLAQYESRLHDEYGLLVMAEDPESMESALRKYFERSLNGTGFDDIENYGKILDLAAKQFDAINLEGSQIYQSEVERQQIIEYMKYRAPVCLADLLLEKLDQLKETKKLAEAMEAQVDFGEKMEECQDAMEDAKKALDNLNDLVNAYPSQTEIQQELDAAEGEYTNQVSRSLLMLAAINHYQKSDKSGDAEESAKGFIGAAGGVNAGSSADDKVCFESYMQCLYYQASAEELQEVLDEWEEQEPDKDSSEHDEWEERMEELKELKESYDDAKNSIVGYPNKLREIANSGITTHTDKLHDYRDRAVQGEKLSKTAYAKLEKVEKKLKEAREKWQKWSEKTDALSKETAGEMKKSVDDYEKFFAEGDAANDQNNLGLLMEAVKSNQIYFGEMKDILTEEKYFGYSIAQASSESQYKKYLQKANTAADGELDQFDDVENLRKQEMVPNYRHTTISTSCMMERIYNYAFYERLIEYCDTSKEDNEKKKNVNNQLDQGKKAGEEASSENGYPSYEWSMVSPMPSVVLGLTAPDHEEKGTIDLGGNVNNGSGRKDAISKFRKAIQQATSFLNGLDRILTDGLEDLYVAEYAMQMFSYYTVDKEDGKKLSEEEVIGLSGYKLAEHKPYKAEVEYFLWGNRSSAANVRYTVAMIFAVRMLFNSFFAFTDSSIVTTATEMATAIAGAAPYLIPVVQVIIQLAYAGIETSNDIAKIKDGYGVTIIKDNKTWSSAPYFGKNTEKLTFDYSEYLRLSMVINMIAGKEDVKLARIADCIYVNTGFDLTKGYTMLALEAEVDVRTTFMRKISDLTSGGWSQPGDSYPVIYQSILGY